MNSSIIVTLGLHHQWPNRYSSWASRQLKIQILAAGQGLGRSPEESLQRWWRHRAIRDTMPVIWQTWAHIGTGGNGFRANGSVMFNFSHLQLKAFVSWLFSHSSSVGTPTWARGCQPQCCECFKGTANSFTLKLWPRIPSPHTEEAQGIATGHDLQHMPRLEDLPEIISQNSTIQRKFKFGTESDMMLHDAIIICSDT